MPERAVALLHLLRIVLGFGRHLADTVERRARRPGFGAIAACFGTGRMAKILAHLHRGILRAMALERVLLARIAHGRDLEIVARRVRAGAPPAVPAHPPAGPPTDPPIAPPVDPRAGRKPASHPSRPRGWNDPELFMPTLEELEAQVRRRPLGRTLVDICLDLAVMPGFCTGLFWNHVFESIRAYGGSISVLMLEKMRRQQTFCKEQDRKPGSDWSWQGLSRDGLRRVLGFNIGEAVVDPFALAVGPDAATAAVATGPP